MSRERIYRRTAAGNCAIAEGNIGIAGSEYRRILDLVGEEMHYDALRAAMPQYSDAVMSRWLRELEARGLLASSAGERAQDLDFTGSFSRAELLQKSGG